jgi:Ca2+-binding EF-hand superfamily protein
MPACREGITVTATTPSDIVSSKLKRRFKLLDQDGNGYIEESDYEDLAHRMASAFDQGLDTAPGSALRTAYLKLWRVLQSRMDADGDGRISEDEFLASVQHSIVEQPGGFDRVIGPIADAVLNLCDTDGDGVLDQGEVTTMLGAFGVSDADAAQAFARLDRDHNGKLTRQELTAAVQEFYCSADADAPGNWFYGRP